MQTTAVWVIAGFFLLVFDAVLAVVTVSVDIVLGTCPVLVRVGGSASHVTCVNATHCGSVWKALILGPRYEGVQQARMV